MVKLFGIAGKIGELSAATALERDLSDLPEVVRPLREGFSGALWQTGKVLSAVSLALALLPNGGRKVPARNWSVRNIRCAMHPLWDSSCRGSDPQ